MTRERATLPRLLTGSQAQLSGTQVQAMLDSTMHMTSSAASRAYAVQGNQAHAAYSVKRAPHCEHLLVYSSRQQALPSASH